MLSLICSIWWLAALAVLFGSAVAACLEPSLKRKNARRGDRPPVSVIVPVRDCSPETAPALTSLFSQSYPAFEVLVSAAGESFSAIAQARSIAALFPDIPSRFIARDPRAAGNPKVNNLALPIAEAKEDLIVVKDSSIRWKPDHLSEMASYFTGDTGLVVSVPLASGPENLPAEIECAAMNGYVARFLLAASAFGLGFGIGASMLFSRRDFEHAGGIAGIANAVGEDHAISKMLNAIGKRTLIAGTVEQIIGRRRFSEVWQRQLRWAVCRRCEAPAAFHAEIFLNPLIAAFAGAAGAYFAGISAIAAFTATLAAAIATDLFLAYGKGWPLSWRTPFATLCFVLMFPALWLQARFVRRILWGDVSFALQAPAPSKTGRAA